MEKQTIKPNPKSPAKKQTVTITDKGKVIINTNAGVITGDGENKIYINGEFTIDADSVSKLSAALQGKNIYILYLDSYGPAQAKIITSDKAIATTIENLKKDIEMQITENRALIDNLKKAELKHSKLLNDVKHFNATRHFWERKIQIPND